MKKISIVFLCVLIIISCIGLILSGNQSFPAVSRNAQDNPSPLACDPPFVQNVRVDDSGVGLYQWTPDITIDGNGILYLVWADNRNGGGVQFDIYFCRSDDGGLTFGNNIKVVDGGEAGVEQSSPKVALGPNDEIYCAWYDFRNGNADIYFAKSTNGGASFDTNVRVDDTGAGGTLQAFPDIACDGAGNIFVAWMDDRNGNNDIFFSRSIDGGVSFEPDVRVDDTGAATGQQRDCSIATDNGGNVSVVWGDYRDSNYDIYYARSTDAGVSFNANVRVDDTGATTFDSGNPDVAVGRDGNISVAWHDKRNGNWDAYYGKSIDNGVSFEPNVRVDDDGASIDMQIQPRVAVDDSGVIIVAWEDSRMGGLWDIFFANSTDGGLSFNTNLRADDSGGGNQWNLGIAAYDGDAYVTWSDQRTSLADDIYFTRTDISPPVSSVDTLPQYWYGAAPITIPFTASDNYCLKDITLWQRNCLGNVTWSPWTSYGTLSITDKLANGNFSFVPPAGDAFYELYTIARDRAYITELAPPTADETLGFDIMDPENSNEYPTFGSTATDASTPVYVHITDQPSGVDVNSLELFVNGSLVSHSATPIPGGFNVSYVPLQPFADSSNNSVVVIAEDHMLHSLNYSWFFYVDLLPPLVSNIYPAPDSDISDLDPTIYLHIADFSDVNESSVKLYVDGYRVNHDATRIANGYNVSYWHDLGFTPGQVVTCRIMADDLMGHRLDLTWNFTVVASFSIPLQDGWNLVSFPVELADNSVASVLGSISGSWDLVQYYDASSNTWKSCATFKPPGLNDLAELDGSMGFWLHTTGPCTLYLNGTLPDYTIHVLKTGWNLVGYPSLNPRTVSDALSGTGYDAVMGFNATAPYRISSLADTYTMTAGEGYWVHVPVDVVWVVDW